MGESRKDGVPEFAKNAMIALPEGSPVQYFSRSRGEWVPAKITGKRSEGDALELDVQRIASFKQVRPLPASTAVLYFSQSQKSWVKALVKGFDAEQSVYVLDIKPMANPAMVRLDPGSMAQELSSATYTPAVGSRALPPPQSSQAAEQVGREAQAREVRPILRRFQCPLCFTDTDLDDGIALDCNHQLCTDCFQGLCDSKIRDGKVKEKELVCPAMIEGEKGARICGTSITAEQVRGNVSRELYEKYCKFSAASWDPGTGERWVRCPTPDCCAFLVSTSTTEVTCPGCKAELCAKCCQRSHRGESCEAYAQRKRAGTEGDRQLEEAIASQGWMRCPVCGTPTELATGCFFMQCQSDKCRGQKHFCYLCGEELQGKDHAPGRSLKHFPRGPYVMECVNQTEEQCRKRFGGKEPPGVQAAGGLVGLMEDARRLLEF